MDTIKCCPKCDNPVISTFMIPGAEWFCIACKWDGGMFSAISEGYTEELSNKRDELIAKFEEVRKDYIPPTAYYQNCKECSDKNEHHILHASMKDKEKSKIAYSNLFDM